MKDHQRAELFNDACVELYHVMLPLRKAGRRASREHETLRLQARDYSRAHHRLVYGQGPRRSR